MSRNSSTTRKHHRPSTSDQQPYPRAGPIDPELANLYSLGLLAPAHKRVKATPSPDIGSSTPGPASSINALSRPSFSREQSKGAQSASVVLENASTGRTVKLAPSNLPSPTPRSRRGMTGMLDIDRSYTRRDRTFAGTQCIVCEEPLEHTLRGEKILQLSCAHVSHEACFYEFIREFDTHRCPGCDAPLGLDSSRGGNVLDIEKLSAIVRSLQLNESHQTSRSTQATPIPWDQANGSRHHSSRHYKHSHRRDQSGRSERYSRSHPHARNTSGGTVGTSAEDSVDHGGSGRKHDYDVQAMEASINTSRSSVSKNPISPPAVAVRSEFPTITRSRQQQSLTCLVTIEVSEQGWTPNAENFQKIQHNQQETQQQSLNKRKAPYENQILVSDESPEELERITEDLLSRVENWHGLDFSRFGKLHLHSTLQVSKDRQSWQELECYLFTEMLICVKEKRPAQQWESEQIEKGKGKCTLKGSIMIKKHLDQIESPDDEECILTLSLSVVELPSFHLHFPSREQFEEWRRGLTILYSAKDPEKASEFEQENSGTDEEDYKDTSKASTHQNSTYGQVKAGNTSNLEQSENRTESTTNQPGRPIHIPVDVVIVIPVSSSMHGLKITLLRDTLRFLVQHLGPRDRMGLVTFGSSGGAAPLVGMTTKTWPGWLKVIDSIRAVGQKTPRADLVEGANIAMDLLMQRKSFNPVSSILIVSDSSSADAESIDFVVSRAEAAKVSIYCFGLGLTHKPDTMIELSTRTKASYTYVKDWMMLRECIAGCLGSLQTTSHQNVKLKLRLPDGSPAKFVKISGALQITKRATGRDAEAALGDLRFGDKRDVLVQLAIPPENATSEQVPQDPWESIVSGLEALGGPLDQEDPRAYSVEEVPMIQADLIYGDVMREGAVTQLGRPCLLAITMLPSASKTKNGSRPPSPPIPPHPSIVQRRMELLTSDMLTRALTLVTRSQQDRAHHLLRETRSILKGLGKGSLPPLPSRSSTKSPISGTQNGSNPSEHSPTASEMSPALATSFPPAQNIDNTVMSALDAELESSLEWINHPAVFGRDSRKAILQAIGVISSQRAYTFRTSLESLWAGRVEGIRRLTELSKSWRDASEDSLTEES